MEPLRRPRVSPPFIFGYMKTCIIGAGASGMATAKVFAERGIDFDWFEMGSDIGGNWRYNNDNGRSAAYDSLHIDTSKERMAYSDFPDAGRLSGLSRITARYSTISMPMSTISNCEIG